MEQVTIPFNLTLQQTPGTTPGTAIIKAPIPTVVNAPSRQSVVEITGPTTTVNIENLTIEGPGSNTMISTDVFVGISVVGGATANVTGDMIDNITKQMSNGETAIGIEVGTNTGQVGHATITDSIITGYQGSGVRIRGGSSGTITDNMIIGAPGRVPPGPFPFALNGIVIDSGGTATITGNTVENNKFLDQSSGIINLGISTITGNHG